MLTFQQIALIMTLIWFTIVVIWFRRSRVALVGGLLVIGIFTLAAFIFGGITPDDLGLGAPESWLLTVGFALAGLVITIAYSPLADRLASHWFKKPPDLESFRAIQQSIIKLIAGIAIAWLLGGILEELIARGIVLKTIEALLSGYIAEPIAAGIAICLAATGAGIMHFYQGPRAVFIIAQISVLFGILFIVSGYNLWAVIICHGLYDTIAFIKFANKKSKYSNLQRG